jgi:hypothetical protein
MINITEQELKMIMAKLEVIPLKYSLELFGFFANKDKEKNVTTSKKKDDNDTAK